MCWLGTQVDSEGVGAHISVWRHRWKTGRPPAHQNTALGTGTDHWTARLRISYGDRLQALYTRQWSIVRPASDRTTDEDKAMHFIIGLRPEFQEDGHTYWRSVDTRWMMRIDNEEAYRLDRVITFFENAEVEKKWMAERVEMEQMGNATREAVGRAQGRGRGPGGGGGRRGDGQGVN
ncbi:hypothetical protein CF326_g8425 [Tilletia indica]|nr:hypothetical protein CF326_g8425 [Tilletia indica]